MNPLSKFNAPLRGARNPGRTPDVTTPGSFANSPDIGGPLMFSSPDTRNMPQPSDKTAWDFLPDGWSVRKLASSEPLDTYNPNACFIGDHPSVTFATARGEVLRVSYPKNFEPITQLESARLGIITPQMRRVAAREPHFDILFPGQGAAAVRDEVAAGRMVIPANINHLKHKLDPMAIGRASLTKVNANMGASPVSSGTHEEKSRIIFMPLCRPCVCYKMALEMPCPHR